MKTYTFEEAQSIYQNVNREELIATARSAGAKVSDDARIWFEDYSAEELAEKAVVDNGVRLGSVSAWVAMEG